MQIDNESLDLFLSQRRQATITAIEPVQQGEWSQTFFFTEDSLRKVIRFSGFDEDFKKDRFVGRFSSPNLPVPPVEEIGQAFDLFFAVSPYVEGEMIDRMDAASMREIVPALMSLLIALHDVDGRGTQGYGGFDAEGNAGGASWKEYLTFTPSDGPENRLCGWKKKLAEDPDAEEIYLRGQEHLLNLIPSCPEERHLIHNDLLHYNLIIRDSKVAAVIDWGCALWGDFLYDLAMFSAWQFYYPAMDGIDFTEEARRVFSANAIPLPNFKERLQCYQLHILLDSLRYSAWKEDRENMVITMGRLRTALSA